MLIKMLDFNILGDERGHLIAIETNRHVPFDIKRVYYLFGTKPEVARGFHAHRELQQVAICISGSCRFLMDDGVNKESVVLDNASQGLFIGPMQWHEMHDFSPDCVLMVLASDVYNERDYIRGYEEFIALSRGC